ncbi:chitin synthase-domain-containing protein, partial [Globomyces pollinis-pini]
MINNYDNVPASKPLLSQLTPKDRKNVTPSGNFFTGGIDKGVATLFKKPGAKSPAPHPADLFAVLLVTCYSEGKEGIKATLDSLAATNYDDRKKLLFVVADGLVQGSGNAQSTPDILISMMDHDPRFGMQPLPQSYVAVGTGSKQHNMAKVYCGCYTYEGRAVPMVLIVKCGTPDEQSGSKPGNRGKRDSQLILMNFFSRVTLNDRMTPLDFDLFRKIHHISGVTPDFYELVLMVDADTMVEPSSVRYLINAVQNDQSIMGLCGETRIENKKASWVTAIQVFEYFISHQMGKAFESVFGGVTCLPGCFSMWRIKSVTRDGTTLPIIANPDILEQYSTNDVYTLHQKNLLLLGEDRFLTTIMLKQFPNRKTVFIPQAVCKTVVPDDFKTLLSQRRRWINSTIHNLMELVMVDTLCGTFCFSMQFVVLMDLLSTAVMPAGLVVTYYLVFSAIFQVQYSTDNITALIMTIAMAVVIFLPAFVVLLTGRRISYVLWMLIYLLALPVWQIILPIYAFWNFDDFSWGETRKVEGHVESKSGHDEGDGSFIASRVAFKRWDQYEREWRRTMIPEDLRRNNSFVREDGRESTVFTDTSN